MFLSTSRANKFSKLLLTQYMKGAHSIKRNIVHRAPAVLVKNMTYLLVNIFVMDLTLKTIKQNRKKFPENGIADSVSFILRNPYEQSRSVINALLSPF